MIYTFTPNPAIDYYIDIDIFQDGKINRANKTFFDVAGKGINCAKIFDLMSIENCAIYFSGGFTGKYLDDSLNEFKYINTKAIKVDEDTRINIKFINKDTAINTLGPSINDNAKEELYEIIDNLNKEDYFIISGSLPLDFSKEDLLKACKKINDKQAKLIIDIPNISFSDLKQIKIFLIKPNLEEFSYLLNKDINLNNYEDYINEVLNNDIENILLSLDKHGSYYAGEYGRYKIDVPIVETKSTVGAGDTILAGFIGSLYNNKDIEESLRFSNACAVGKVTYNHLDEIDKINVFKDDIVLIKK